MKPYVKSVAASQETLDAVSASEATKLNQTQVDARVEAVTGKLSSLTTTAKTNLVAAVNEVKAASPTMRFSTTQPSEPVAGDATLDVSSGKLYIYDGTGWKYATLTAVDDGGEIT